MEAYKTREINWDNINCDDYTQADFMAYRGKDLFDGAIFFDQFAQDYIAKGYMVYGSPVSTAPGPEFDIIDRYTGKARHFLNFCSYNYLGFCMEPEVKKAVQNTVERYGTGASSAPLLSGYYDMTKMLEDNISRFKGKGDTIVFPTGYGVNLGVISAILKPGDVAVLDILAHASIYDGVKMSGADLKVFSHNNPRHLERILRNLNGKRVLVCVEGVYSMDGDLAKLPEIVAICKKYGAKILLDEAHSTLIFGKNGRGVAEHFGVEDEIDLTIGTFSKSFGAIGGYVTGDSKLMYLLRVSAHSYVFSCGMAPHTAAGIIKVLELYQQDNSCRDLLLENAKYMRTALTAAGFDIGESESQVIPVIVGNDRRLREISKRVFERNLYTGVVTFPAVSSKRTRLRLSISATHIQDQMDQVVQILTDVFDETKDVV